MTALAVKCLFFFKFIIILKSIIYVKILRCHLTAKAVITGRSPKHFFAKLKSVLPPYSFVINLLQNRDYQKYPLVYHIFEFAYSHSFDKVYWLQVV